MSDADADTVQVERESEIDAVVRWRLLRLIEGGWPVHPAEAVAARLDVDLHVAIDLLERGCDPTVALDILL